jgi:hypothetical protein
MSLLIGWLKCTFSEQFEILLNISLHGYETVMAGGTHVFPMVYQCSVCLFSTSL